MQKSPIQDHTLEGMGKYQLDEAALLVEKRRIGIQFPSNRREVPWTWSILIPKQWRSQLPQK
jgi:hypothetical protein